MQKKSILYSPCMIILSCLKKNMFIIKQIAKSKEEYDSVQLNISMFTYLSLIELLNDLQHEIGKTFNIEGSISINEEDTIYEIINMNLSNIRTIKKILNENNEEKLTLMILLKLSIIYNKIVSIIINNNKSSFSFIKEECERIIQEAITIYSKNTTNNN